MKYIPREDVEWKKVRYIKEPLEGTDEAATWKYEFYLNEPLASWDVFSYWEKERIASMEKHLKAGDILFDIGTEQGWCNLAYAKMVGPSNIVLIEPTKEFWPNIKALWQRNLDGFPLDCINVLFSDKTTQGYEVPSVPVNGWPKESYGDLIDRNKYQYIHANSEDIPEVKLDDYVARSGIVPDALTMDTEGSELLILRGARKTLDEHNLKVWISIHPDLGLKDYGIDKSETIKFMKDLGYKGEYLATDHEEHWYFRKESE